MITKTIETERKVRMTSWKRMMYFPTHTCYLSSIFACNNLFEVVHVLVLLKSSIFFIHSPKYIGFIPTSALFTDNFFCLGSIKFCLVYLLKFCECTLYKNGKFQEGLVCSFVWSGWEIWNFELLEICWCNLSDKFHVRLLCLLEPHCKWLRKQPMFVVVQLHLRLGFSSISGEKNKKKLIFQNNVSICTVSGLSGLPWRWDWGTS